MKCSKCGSSRIFEVSAKCSDLFHGNIRTIEFDSYVPNNLGIGGGDYVEIDLCLDCGQAQGDWPVSLCKEEKKEADRESFNIDNLSSSARKLYQLVLKLVEELVKVNDLDIFVEFFNAIILNKYLKPSGEVLIDYLEDWDHYEELCKRINLDGEYDD